MDFKRVEGIFLIVFLFLNMFLYYVYQEGKSEQNVASTGSISENIEGRLRSDGITLPHSLSEKVQQGYYLSAEEGDLVTAAKEQLEGQEWHVYDDQLVSDLALNTQVTVDDKNEMKQVKAFVNKKSNVIQGATYELNKHQSESGSNYIFNQEWEGLPIYDETSQLNVYLETLESGERSIVSYDQTRLSNIEPLRDPQNLISEREALISLYTNNRLQAGDKVKWIDLGYTRIFTVREKNVYIPAWFIAVENSKSSVQVERVNAFSNTIISTNVSEVKN